MGVSSGWNNRIADSDYVIYKGGSVGDVYGYTTVGRYEVDDFICETDDSGNTTWTLVNGDDSQEVAELIGTVRPGSLRLATDADGKPVYGKIGSVLPKFTGGFSLSGYAYGFDFAANFTYSYGNKVYNANKLEYSASHTYTGAGQIRNLLDFMSLGSRWTNIDWETGQVITDPVALAEVNRNTTMWSPYMTGNFGAQLGTGGCFVPAAVVADGGLHAAEGVDHEDPPAARPHLRHGYEPLLLDALYGLRPGGRHAAFDTHDAQRRLFGLSEEPFVGVRHQPFVLTAPSKITA